MMQMSFSPSEFEPKKPLMERERFIAEKGTNHAVV